jgi:hypothetical protein
MSAIAFDPLIAEAQRRAARRRRFLLLALALVGVGVAVYSIAQSRGPGTAATPRFSIPAGATGAACGVRGVGTRILDPAGRSLYSEPGPPSNRGFPSIQCSGSAIWAVWFNGAGAGSESYFGARSLDDGRTWRASFAQRAFGRKAPHAFGAYLGAWALHGSRDAYFVSSCWACSVSGVSNTNELFVTTDGGRTFSHRDLGSLTGYGVTGIRVRGSAVVLRAKRFIDNVSPPRKTVIVRVG